MKFYNNILLALTIFSILTAADCNKNKEPLEQLPPETQTGAGTFGCLVNGEAFKPKASSIFSRILTCTYQYIYPSSSGFVFALDATKEGDGCSFTSIIIGADSIKLEEGKVYKLMAFGKGNVNGQYGYTSTCGPSTRLFTSATNTGELVLKKFDETNQIAAGTFWFNVVNTNGEIIRITDGRFDMKYTR